MSLRLVNVSFYVTDYCNNSAKDGTVTEQKQKTELDLNIPPKSE